MLQTALVPFFLSLLISAISVPVIIRVANLKNLTDSPDSSRKLHKSTTPTLGGIAIFAGTLVVFSAFYDLYGFADLKFITSALVILFFSGIKDDLLVLDPIKKLLIQVVCAALITHFGALRITSLWGILTIQEVGPLAGTLLTITLIVGLINAFNLIDGINGLAGSLGALSSLCFGIWFAFNGYGSLTVLSFSLAGALIGFLFFNYNRAKIFMGDTGSMAVGFILSILAIRFIEANRLHLGTITFPLINAPAVAFAVLSIPIFDMTRLFILRIMQGRSPFSADRSHIHHYFVDRGISHANANCIIFMINVSCVLIVMPLHQLRSMWGILILIIYLSIAYSLALLILRRKPSMISAQESNSDRLRLNITTLH